ncbi:MAG: MBL fold metallo-hydrolase [Myxococcales bacterium]|nr:MBL fold metallo-hydrolase [Myxococcales bacterium]
MKQLHRTDLYSWSEFNEEKAMDFNSVVWVREEGNVVIDPVPMEAEDQDHLMALGGAAWIVITNSDHIRASRSLSAFTGAMIAGPSGERGSFIFPCDRWLEDGEEVVPGLEVIEIHGSKTSGELALLLEETTLITGDLIRGIRMGELHLLGDEKLHDKDQVLAFLEYLASLTQIETVLVGDGWSLLENGHEHLCRLLPY